MSHYFDIIIVIPYLSFYNIILISLLYYQCHISLTLSLSYHFHIIIDILLLHHQCQSLLYQCHITFIFSFLYYFYITGVNHFYIIIVISLFITIVIHFYIIIVITFILSLSYYFYVIIVILLSYYRCQSLLYYHCHRFYIMIEMSHFLNCPCDMTFIVISLLDYQCL